MDIQALHEEYKGNEQGRRRREYLERNNLDRYNTPTLSAQPSHRQTLALFMAALVPAQLITKEQRSVSTYSTVKKHDTRNIHMLLQGIQRLSLLCDLALEILELLQLPVVNVPGLLGGFAALP